VIWAAVFRGDTVLRCAPLQNNAPIADRPYRAFLADLLLLIMLGKAPHVEAVQK
jgi:hypothetical protein